MSTAQTILGAASGLSEIPLYPVLTREVGPNNTAGGSSSVLAGVAGSLPALAKNAIRSALGWQYRGGDSTANLRSFEAALGKAFRFREVEGHTEWDWVPQGFTMQADLGEITGAQASIYRQAQVMLDQTIPVLDKLEPLREAADDEDIEAMRAIIRNELTDLVSELGVPGGPRVQKVDHYFCLLIAAHDAASGANAAVQYDPRRSDFGGQLRRFRDRLGMTESRVNTIEEEVAYTDFILLTDNIASLHRTWLQKRPSFTWEDRPFFGTLLTHLARQMEVIAESIHELYATLDSVYVGPAERQVVDLGSREVFVKDKDGGPLSGNKDLKRIQERAGKVLEEGEDGVQSLFVKPQATAGKPALKLNAADHKHLHNLLTDVAEADDLGTALRSLGRLKQMRSMSAQEYKNVLAQFGVRTLPVGLDARSLTLDGLFSWIDSFVTKDGRQLLELGGKDGAVTFACTVRKLADYVHLLLIYSAQYSTELYAEIGSALHSEAYVSTGLDFHPGLHSARAYRAIRELFTHLNTAARLSGKDNVDYRASLCCEELEEDHDCPDCKEDDEVLTAPITQPGYPNVPGINLNVSL